MNILEHYIEEVHRIKEFEKYPDMIEVDVTCNYYGIIQRINHLTDKKQWQIDLEKQIPKKPYLDNDNSVYEKEHCPTCHRSLFPNEHHCKCGQSLDWSDLSTENVGDKDDK